jgi:hypothetical protein
MDKYEGRLTEMAGGIIKPVWGIGVPKPGDAALDFVNAHPECLTDPELIPLTSVWVFAAHMVGANPVPAMFREYLQTQKALFKAMGKEEELPTLGDLLKSGADDEPVR